MKTICIFLISAMFVGCATNKDPVWSEYYYPQEVLLKPAPKAESSRVQRKDVSPTHSHILGKIAPFFPQRSPQPESPIPNTARWINEPRPFLYPIGFIIAKIKIAEPFRV
jgi:hypothetical protein